MLSPSLFVDANKLLVSSDLLWLDLGFRMLGREGGSGLGLCLKPELLLCREGLAHTLDSILTDGHWDAPPLLHEVLPVEQSYWTHFRSVG